MLELVVTPVRRELQLVRSNPRSQSFNLPLNGFRGLCAFTVFLYHVANANVITMDAYGPVAEYALSSLRYGVELFFLISGFVIAGSLARHASFGAFLRDRFIRIYSAWAPLIVFVSVVCATFHLKMFENVTVAQGLGMFVANFLLLPPLIPVTLVHAVSWSLTYEWVFYFAAATGAILLGRPRAEARWPLALWALTIACFVALFPRALFFIPGVIVFGYRDWFERRRSWLRLPLLSFVVFMVAWRYTNVDKAELTETMFDWAHDGRIVAAAVAFVASVHMFASITLRVTSEFAFLESRAFQFLGKISYSFYLWHLLVVSAVKRVIAALVIPYTGPELGVVCVAICTLAVSIPVAWASWQLLEVRLAKVMRTALTPTPLATTAVAATPAATAELPSSRSV